jgi:hypothetical protein
MSKRSLDAATIQTYLESLPEAEVAAIFETVVLKAKRRWEFWLGVLLFVVWSIVWIWVTSGFRPVSSVVGGLVAMFMAAGFLWPFVRWLNNRVLRDEVALRISANGV